MRTVLTPAPLCTNDCEPVAYCEVSHVTLPEETVAPAGRLSSISTSSPPGGEGCEANGVVHCADATRAEPAKTTRDTNSVVSLMPSFMRSLLFSVRPGRPERTLNMRPAGRDG